MASLKTIGYILLFYSLLIFSGGTVGFVLKKSLPSLAAGSLFGLALLWVSVLHFTERRWSIYLSFILLFMLEAFFAFRFLTTFAFIPAGLMLGVTSVTLLLLIGIHLKSRQHSLQ